MGRGSNTVKRMCIVTILLAGTLPLRISAEPAPVLKFSLYALVQRDAPLRIVDFKYDSSDLELIMANRSDKVVTGVVVAKRLTAPSGCSVDSVEEPTTVEISSGSDWDKVHIDPYQKQTVSDSMASLVLAAQHLGAAGIQVQVEVTEVDFSDGTRWRPTPDPRLPTARPMMPFILSLLDADAGMCSSPETIVKALENVRGTRLEAEGGLIRHSIAIVGGGATPHLTLECKLQGTMAVCPKR